MVIRAGLVTKVFRVLETLALLYYPVTLIKIKYLVITLGVITPPKLLLITGLSVLYPRTKV